MNDFNWCKLNMSNSNSFWLMGNVDGICLKKEYYEEKNIM